jgi:hypothetical protein
VVDENGDLAADVLITIWRHGANPNTPPGGWGPESLTQVTTDANGWFGEEVWVDSLQGTYAFEFGGAGWTPGFLADANGGGDWNWYVTDARVNAKHIEVGPGGPVIDLGFITLPHSVLYPPAGAGGELVSPVGIDSNGDIIDNSDILVDLDDLVDLAGTKKRSSRHPTSSLSPSPSSAPIGELVFSTLRLSQIVRSPILFPLKHNAQGGGSQRLSLSQQDTVSMRVTP